MREYEIVYRTHRYTFVQPMSAYNKHFTLQRLHIYKSLRNIHGTTAGSASNYLPTASPLRTTHSHTHTHIHMHTTAQCAGWSFWPYPLFLLPMWRFGKCLYYFEHFSFLVSRFLNRLSLRVYIVRLYMIARLCTFCHFNCR